MTMLWDDEFSQALPRRSDDEKFQLGLALSWGAVQTKNGLNL